MGSNGHDQAGINKTIFNKVEGVNPGRGLIMVGVRVYRYAVLKPNRYIVAGLFYIVTLYLWTFFQPFSVACSSLTI